MKTDPFSVIEKYRKPAVPKPASLPIADRMELATGNLQDAIKDISFVNRPCQLELIVKHVAPCPIGPVNVASDFGLFGAPPRDVDDPPQVRSTIAAPYITILDPAKFVSATLADLARYVAAKNQGRHYSWIEDFLDEKIEQLRLCGVEAEIRAVQ